MRLFNSLFIDPLDCVPLPRTDALPGTLLPEVMHSEGHMQLSSDVQKRRRFDSRMLLNVVVSTGCSITLQDQHMKLQSDRHACQT